MTTTLAVFLLLCLGLATSHHHHHHHEEANPRDFYRAAVYEHVRFDNNSLAPREAVETNLGYYKRAAEIAKSKGADVIVYPEYGLFPALQNRSEIRVYLENIPDPNEERYNPCEQVELYSDRQILFTLSCIAKNNSMFVVANMGNIQNCKGDTDCPEDGSFHFNTNVVFDRNGTLLVRYHKEHLFYEFGMDVAREQQNSTFETDFGTFATYICFDIDFGRMSEVAQWPNVDGVMFSTMFIDQPPQMTSVQYWQSWALGNNATLLAANVQNPGYGAVGSGIFHGEQGALAYTFNPDGIPKLVVSTVHRDGFNSEYQNSSITAITESDSYEWKHDGKDVPLECSTRSWNDTVDLHSVYRCLVENYTDYTFVKLTEAKGHVEACNNGLCCSLNYSTDGLTGNFYLGAFSGIYRHFTRYSWCEEDCVLARCDASGEFPCGTFIMNTDIVFRNVHLSGNFTSKTVYPSVITNGMRLVPTSEWHQHGGPTTSKRVVHFDNHDGKELAVVGMKGRCYDKDPPYVR